MVGWLSSFVRWHTLLLWLAVLPLCFTLREDLRRANTRSLARSFIVVNLLACVSLSFHPLLPNLPEDERSFIWGIVSLFPLLWVAAIDYKSRWKERAWVMEASSLPCPILLLTSLFLSLLYFVIFYLRYIASGIASFSRTEMLVVLMWSITSHLLVFGTIFLVLRLLRATACRFRASAKAWFLLRSAALALLGMTVLSKIVLNAVSFNDLTADFYAASLSFVLITFLSGLVIGLDRFAHADESSRLAVSRLKQLLPAQEALLSVKLLWLALISLIAYLIPVEIASTDWDSLLQKLSALLVWALATLFFSRIMPSIKMKRQSLALLLLVATTGVCGFKFLDNSRAKIPALLHDGHLDVPILLEQYASYDISYGVARKILSPAEVRGAETSAEKLFYDYLGRSTNIPPGGSAAPAPINLVPALEQSSGKKPNIFIFVVDSLRQDYVSPYNSKVKFTPSIERFARESVVMKNAFTRYGGTALSEPALWAGAMQLHMRYVHPFYPMNSLQHLIEAERYKPFITVDPILSEILRPSSDIVELDRGAYWEEYDFSRTLTELQSKLDERDETGRPIFVYTQPQNVHMAALQRHAGKLISSSVYSGFDAQHADEIARIDDSFGKFIQYLKRNNLYDDSIIVLTSDHGDSLGEEGHWGHSTYIYPEVMRIPLIIHLPPALQKNLFYNTENVAFSTDITPSLYYLLGHSPVARNELFGRPLFTESAEEQSQYLQESYLVASSYGAVYGTISDNGRSLFIADVGNQKSCFYDMSQSYAGTRRSVPESIRAQEEQRILMGVKAINKFYRFQPDERNEFSLKQLAQTATLYYQFLPLPHNF